MDEFFLKVMERNEEKEVMKEALIQYKNNLTRSIICYELLLDDLYYGDYDDVVTMAEIRAYEDIGKDYKEIIDNYYWKRAIVESLLEEL